MVEPAAPAWIPSGCAKRSGGNGRTKLARLMLMWFLTTDAPVAWVGTAQSPDGTADVLEVKPAEGAATRVFLDSTTHMPLMMTNTGFGGGRGRRGAAPTRRCRRAAGGADGRSGRSARRRSRSRPTCPNTRP